jgi:hypothetical protein
MKSTRLRAALAASLAIGLLAGACGDDDDEATGETSEATEATDDTTEGTEDEAGGLEVTLSDEGLDGLPDTFAGGAVEVTFADERAEGEDGGELNFTSVEEGTTAEQFAEEFAVVFEGGPFPDFVVANAGVGSADGSAVTSTILLEPGPHVVWFEEGGGDEEGGSTINGTLVEVTEGEATELPETDGEIVAVDYGFEITGATGPGTFTFRNDGPDQHHHALVVDFGTNEASVAEEALPLLVAGDEDAPPPDVEGFDMGQVDFEFAGTGVFGPGLGGTFEADFQEGNTYALVCFISDSEGGPPHAIGMEMYEVFTVGG